MTISRFDLMSMAVYKHFVSRPLAGVWAGEGVLCGGTCVTAVRSEVKGGGASMYGAA